MWFWWLGFDMDFLKGAQKCVWYVDWYGCSKCFLAGIKPENLSPNLVFSSRVGGLNPFEKSAQTDHLPQFSCEQNHRLVWAWGHSGTINPYPWSKQPNKTGMLWSGECSLWIHIRIHSFLNKLCWTNHKTFWHCSMDPHTIFTRNPATCTVLNVYCIYNIYIYVHL